MHGRQTADGEEATHAVSYSSKYERAIELKRVRARKLAECLACGDPINPGDHYYRQSLGRISKPPRLQLSAFCLSCKDSPLARRLHTTP